MCWHASPLFKKVKNTKTVRNNVFPAQKWFIDARALESGMCHGKGCACSGGLGDNVIHNHFSTLNFSSEKVLQAHSPEKLKAPV